MNVFGLNEGGYRYLTGIKNCQEHLNKDEFLMDQNVAEKVEVEIGDTGEVKISEEGCIPVTKHQKV